MSVHAERANAALGRISASRERHVLSLSAVGGERQNWD